jgi:hypothetical protein
MTYQLSIAFCIYVFLVRAKAFVPLYAEIHFEFTNVRFAAQKAYFAYSRLKMDIEKDQRSL